MWVFILTNLSFLSFFLSISQLRVTFLTRTWGKAFDNEPNKICGRLHFMLSVQTEHIILNFLRAVFHKFYLFHSWILCVICPKPMSLHQVVSIFHGNNALALINYEISCNDFISKCESSIERLLIYLIFDLLGMTFIPSSASIYLLKVSHKNTKKSIKYVQK